MPDDDEIRDDLLDDYDEELIVQKFVPPGTARIAFARILGLSLGTTGPGVRELLIEALQPGTRVEHYRRIWRMGRVSEEGLSIVGRIGFEAASVAEVFDEVARDFRDHTAPAGQTSPFAIDPSTLRVAFQLRSGVIRARSFTGALQALMNAASPTERWRVSQELETATFDEWRSSISRVLRLRARLERPNPHYGDRRLVEQIVEGTNAQLADLALTADPDDPQGLDADDPLVREMIAHAAKYGRVRAVGERRGLPSTWDSTTDGVAETRTLITDPTTREVDPTDLRHELGDSSPAS